jgi:3-(3-hydroxy-phenyl)propionate hydroxylase
MSKAQVLVVGAGPVGTVGALRLATMGFDVAICESEPSSALDLRASTFHAPTLEMLHDLDVSAPLLARGLKAPIYQMRERRTGEKLAFDLSEIADRTHFPFRLQCEQHFMAAVLSERLQQMDNVDIRFSTRLIHAEQVGDEVVATVETAAGRSEIRCDFLIGADGAHSTVRKVMGVGFEGFTYDAKFLSLSTAFPIETVVSDLDYVNYISDPDEWLVLLRVPGLWRVLVPADADQPDAAILSDENVRRVFSRIVGDHPIEVAHKTIYRVHQRVAQTFTKSRLQLVGDAAHLNNPLGGFGMNSGIHDVWNLADKLEAILRGRGDAELLGRFDRQRRAATRNFIQAQTQENMAFMQQGKSESHRLRQERMRAIHGDPQLRREYLLQQAMFKSLEDAEKIV